MLLSDCLRRNAPVPELVGTTKKTMNVEIVTARNTIAAATARLPR
jgi:hypothetical protein